MSWKTFNPYLRMMNKLLINHRILIHGFFLLNLTSMQMIPVQILNSNDDAEAYLNNVEWMIKPDD